MPGVTNEASTHPILQAGVESGSGLACQPNYHGDLALAPRPPIDLDYMEHDTLRSMHGHAPVVHDRLVTDHHEIHHTIDSGIKSSLGGMHSHVTVGVASEDDPRREAVVSNEPAISSDALSPPRLLELWEAEIDSILGDQRAVHKLRTASDVERLEAEFSCYDRQQCDGWQQNCREAQRPLLWDLPWVRYGLRLKGPRATGASGGASLPKLAPAVRENCATIGQSPSSSAQALTRPHLWRLRLHRHVVASVLISLPPLCQISITTSWA